MPSGIRRALRCTLAALLAVALNGALNAAGAQPGAAPGAFTSAFVARWNLTHGEYLVDIGEYLEAIEAFDTAIEMADGADVRDEAQLQKASVLAVFLDAPDDALRVYDALIAQNPAGAAAETALFRAGMTLFDAEQYGRAATYFDRYLRQYPEGASRASAELLLKQSRAQAASAAAAAPTPAPPQAVASPAMPTALGRPRPTVGQAAGAPATPPVVAAPVGPIPSVAEVRVRVFKGHSNLRVESDGPLTVTPPIGETRAVALTAHGGLISINGGPGVREVTIRSDHPLALHADRDSRHYRGSLTVRADGDTLLVVNHVGMEEYLYGVVTKESVPTWPLESLKAQAIASRTYALFQVQHRRDRPYDMVDDEGSQVYGGVEGESPAGRRAVDETRGTILMYGARPIYAMFTANSGWYTGDPKFVFDQPLPYLTAAPDPYSQAEQLGRWTRSYSAAEVQRSLADIGVRLGTIRSIQPQMTCPSGRIIRVAIEDEQGAHVMRTRPTLGRALKLPEILVAIRREGDKFVFAGGGFGHGVGLSQWGAKDMAGKGMSVKEILAFYYPGAALATASPQ